MAAGGPTHVQAAAGAEVIVNINASPFHIGKSRVREQMLATRARENGVIVTYTNMVGGQDELVFDGNSLILDPSGNVIARGPAFREELIVADLDVDAVSGGRLAHGRQGTLTGNEVSIVDRLVVNRTAIEKEQRTRVVSELATPLEEMEEVYHALVLAVKDYVQKNGLARVVIGLSGGVDSAVTAAIAVDALGAKHVRGIFMPSPYTSHESEEDVAELGRCLGIDVTIIPITPAFEVYRQSLAPSFVGRAEDATEENLQARIRGTILMAISNKFGHLVLTTGNKSEMSVGYSTLYGDMAGGFAVIKDVPKTMVYSLARFRNERGPLPVIPKRILDRPPTAELRPNQKDEDSLPPYDVARSHTACLCRRRPLARPNRRSRVRFCNGLARGQDGRSQRIQATSGTHWCQDHPPRLRQGPTDADYERLPHDAVITPPLSFLIIRIRRRDLSNDFG